MLKYTLQALQNIHRLNDDSLALFKKELEYVELKKGDILFSPRVKHHYFNFLEKGLLRGYVFHEEKELTLFFGIEGSIVFPYATYLSKYQ